MPRHYTEEIRRKYCKLLETKTPTEIYREAANNSDNSCPTLSTLKKWKAKLCRGLPIYNKLGRPRIIDEIGLVKLDNDIKSVLKKQKIIKPGGETLDIMSKQVIETLERRNLASNDKKKDVSISQSTMARYINRIKKEVNGNFPTVQVVEEKEGTINVGANLITLVPPARRRNNFKKNSLDKAKEWKNFVKEVMKDDERKHFEINMLVKNPQDYCLICFTSKHIFEKYKMPSYSDRKWVSCNSCSISMCPNCCHCIKFHQEACVYQK